jgi:hypothetical protein
MKKQDKDRKEKKILAYCGIDCGACPAYIATQNDDDVLRAGETGDGLSKREKNWGQVFHNDSQCDIRKNA